VLLNLPTIVAMWVNKEIGTCQLRRPLDFNTREMVYLNYETQAPSHVNAA
jgi:hypothetical protein